MPEDRQKIAEALFHEVRQGESLYAILDGARSPDIAFRLRSVEDEHASLYRGRSEELLWYVAPYVVRCQRDSAVFSWILEEGWGNSWGIFAVAGSSLDDLCKHLRRFLLVDTDDGRRLYFRFYDPRVLRVFLPTCTIEETRDFFGVIRCFLTEAPEPDGCLKFSIRPDGLEQKAALSEVESAQGIRRSI